MRASPENRQKTAILMSIAFAILLLVSSIIPKTGLGAVIGSPGIVQATSHNCTVSIGAPVKVSGPAVRGSGNASCPDGVERLNFEVEVYMWANGAWNRVARNWNSCGNCTFTSAVATSGRCAGTKQYFTQVRAQWYDFGGRSGSTGWKYSSVKWITC